MEDETPSINDMYIKTWQEKVIRIQIYLFLLFLLGLRLGRRELELWPNRLATV